MNRAGSSRRGPRLTTKGMLLGGLAGGLVGAFARGGITYLHLRSGGTFGLLASLPSAGIGFLCGMIAGAACRGRLGAVVGATLSAAVFALFLLPVAYLFDQFDAAIAVGRFSWRLFVQKAIAGALAGGIGGYIGSRVVAAEQGQEKQVEQAGPSLRESLSASADGTRDELR